MQYKTIKSYLQIVTKYDYEIAIFFKKNDKMTVILSRDKLSDILLG